MKKLLFNIGIVLIVIFIFFSSLYVIDHIKMDNNKPVIFSTWGKQYVPPEGITREVVVENAKKKLDDKIIATITNYDNPKVEEVVFDTKLSIPYFENKNNFVGKSIYKITFNTTQDGLLGPIVFYFDKLTGKLIGMGSRG